MKDGTALLPPIEGKAYCGCGCGRRASHAHMADRPHPGFGGVGLLRDGEFIYPWPDATMDEEYERTFQDYEDVAAGDPDHDWRLQVDGPLSDYTYQRQGEDVWALVAQGQGFA